MPIELRTGLPGSGKSLGVVERLQALRKDGAGRPVYVHGIAGLADGLGLPLDADGVRAWRDLPAGSLVIVDEAQKLMPARRGTADAPEWIRALSEHRHLGVDFVLCTQHPSLIDAYVRRLVDLHEHVVRMYGSHTSQIYRWSSVETDPVGRTARKNCEMKRYWRFPTRAYGDYQSAEVHTVKRRMPRFVWVALGLAVALPVFGVMGWLAMRHAASSAGAGRGQSASGGDLSDSVPLPASASGGGVQHPDKAEWARLRTPRVQGIPWSAPMWDGLRATTTPDLYCIEVEGKCQCYTEQITRVTVAPGMCREFARHGVYNPYRAVAVSPVPVGSPSPSDAGADSADGRDAASAPAEAWGVHATQYQRAAWRSQPYRVPGADAPYRIGPPSTGSAGH